MKNIIYIVSTLFFGLVLTTTSQAADRCTGKVSKTLIEQEAVQNMYYDVALHQVICEYAGTREQYKKATDQWMAVRTQYKSCIISSQDAMVAHLGGEGPFENMYAAIGNQISYLNLPDPCGRVEQLSKILLTKKYSCRSGIVKAYAPSFKDLVAKYEAKSSGRLFRRVCDY